MIAWPPPAVVGVWFGGPPGSFVTDGFVCRMVLLESGGVFRRWDLIGAQKVAGYVSQLSCDPFRSFQERVIIPGASLVHLFFSSSPL